MNGTRVADTGLVDRATRERVGRTALDRTLFVEAGAGSGKTSLLVDRVVSLVLLEGVRLASIAAITFTEAAASELQTRIRAEFEKSEAQAVERGDHELARRCRAAVDDTDLAAITTLHGFANRILGEHAVAAGLPPRVRVLDEVASQLAHEDRWQRFVDRIHDDERHRDLLVTASVLDIPLEPRYLGHATMREVAVVFNQNWDRLPSFIERDLGPSPQPSFEGFDAAVRHLESCLALCCDPDDKLKAHLDTILPEMHAVVGVADPLRKLRMLRHARGWTVGGASGRAAAWGDKQTVADVKQAIRDVNDAASAVLGPIINDVLLRLAQVIAAEIHDAAMARRAEGGLEFHDLLVLARDMLRTSPRARQRLHERYRYLLLDEFQDTDPIQIELAVLIATGADDVAGRPWHDLSVGDGSVFFVGDPKQSIYRFRRADIALFLEAQQTFAAEDGPERLSTNFRTVEPIVEWVNAMFAATMGDGVPGAQPRYEPLVADRTLAADARERHRPVLLGGPHDDPKISAGDLRAVEAADVAGAIRAIAADPSQWQVCDRAIGAWRPARLADITVLLPTRTSLPFLRAALDDAAVRYRIATGTLVYDTQEVTDALAALRAVDDPTDELSLVAALRSPLYACSDVDLFTWRHAGGRWDYLGGRPPGVGPEHPVALAFAHLESLWRDRWFETPSGLLDRLLRERKAALLAFGDRRPIDVWRRLRFLVEQARSFEEADSGGLRAFAQWAELQGGSMARVHEPLLPETDDDAVSIQTIHGAKGLEFPITILSGMTTQFRVHGAGVRVLWTPDGEPSVRMSKGVETHSHEPRADLEAEMDDHEKLRLAYVATTRARDHLLVSCHHKAGAADKCYGGRFWQVFDHDDRRRLARRFDWREVVGRIEPERHGPAQLGLPLDDRAGWVRERDALLRRVAAPRVLSATAIARAALTGGGEGPTVDRALPADDDDDRADELDDSESAAGPVVRRRGRTGSAIGSAVHAVLQAVDFGDATGLDAHVTRQCEVHGVPHRSLVVRRLVDAALGSQAVALARRHQHIKELFVAAPVGDRVIEGYVDLLIETPDGLIVVDYKTDSVHSDADVDAKLAAYELQAAAYAVALEAVTGRPVVECRFVFCRSAGAIERTVADLDGAKRRVRSVVHDGAATRPVESSP